MIENNDNRKLTSIFNFLFKTKLNQGRKTHGPLFRPLVNQRNDAIAYTNSFRNQYFSVNRIHLREKREN